MATPSLAKYSYASFSSPFFYSKPNTKASISSSLPSSFNFHYPKARVSCFFSLSTIYSNRKKTTGFPTVLALIEKEQFAATAPSEFGDDSASWNQLKPCELYVCNLPSGCDISQLLEIFKPFGTVQSVEVSRDAETGLSRGCGYVTMSSIGEAKAGIAVLDGSDVSGREMRVTFSVDVNNGRRNIDALNSTPKRNLIFESPYKIYAGNLAWSIKPEDLRNIFCQFGTVVSARVLHDRKGGKNRVYGFLSFSSAAELEAAMALNGTEYRGRKIILREVLKENEP